MPARSRNIPRHRQFLQQVVERWNVVVALDRDRHLTQQRQHRGVQCPGGVVDGPVVAIVDAGARPADMIGDPQWLDTLRQTPQSRQVVRAHTLPRANGWSRACRWRPCCLSRGMNIRWRNWPTPTGVWRSSPGHLARDAGTGWRAGRPISAPRAASVVMARARRVYRFTSLQHQSKRDRGRASV